MTKEEPPSIVINHNERTQESELKQLCLGMEEEGVPFQIEASAELNPLILAQSAALSSRLGVGIGVSLDYVVVTTEKLPEGRPYLAEFTSATADRITGSNAARLVKRIPLRAVERSH